MEVVGDPIEGSRGWSEEIALLFAEAAQHEARKFVHASELDARMAVADARRLQAEETLEAMRQQSASSRADVARIASHPPALLKVPFAALLVVIGVLVAVGGLVLGPVGALLMIAVGAVGAFMHHSAANALAAAKASAEESLGLISTGIAQTEAQVAAARDERALLASEHAQLTPQRVVQAVGRVYLPFVAVDVAGYPALVDGSGSTATTQLELPDLAANADAVGRVRDTIVRLSDAPMLLRASSDDHSSADTLHGEERDLGEAIADFGDVLAEVPIFTAALPMVAKDSALARAIARPARAASDVPGAVIRGDAAGTRCELAKVTRYAERMRGSGKGVEQELRSLRDDLHTTIARFGELRSAAVEDQHVQMHAVLARTELAYVTYYCPKCNRIPQYLFDRIGIDLDSAHELPARELLRALQEDPEAQRRLVDDVALQSELDQVYTALGEVVLALTEFDRARATDASVGAVHASASRGAALIGQHEQLLAQFRSVLRKIVTGSARPLLELSRQARLQLDPDTGHWDCPLCELHVDTPEVARMGRLLKIKDDLLMPMWNQLWTEKDDFRKSELFRTNDQIQALLEKETVALREVSEQYRADMRPVRENLIISTTEALHKRDQLDAAVSSLTLIGVIDQPAATATMGRLGSMTGGDLGAMRSRAEAKETLLNQEPQAQMNRRATARDPVQMLTGPEALYRERVEFTDRVSLPRLQEPS